MGTVSVIPAVGDDGGVPYQHYTDGGHRNVLMVEGTVRWTDVDELPFDLELRIGLGDSETDGPPEVLEVRAIRKHAGPPISPGAIQRTQLGRWIREAVRRLGSPAVLRSGYWVPAPGDIGEHVDWLLHPNARPRVPSGDVEIAAEAYKRAQADGRPTTEAVRAALDSQPGAYRQVTSDVARKRVQKARDRGLLPPAESTRPLL